MIHALYHIWTPRFSYSVNLTSDAPQGHNTLYHCPYHPSLPDPPPFPHISPVLPPLPSLFMPLFHSLCVCTCACVHVLEQRFVARGKSSTLLGWPSSDNVIHPYPFTSPTPLHSFPFSPLPPKQTPKDRSYVTGTRRQLRTYREMHNSAKGLENKDRVPQAYLQVSK